MSKIIGFIILCILLVGVALYSGFVFSTIWGYFIVPLGAAALSLPHALGIILVAGYPFMGIYRKLERIQETTFTLEAFGQYILNAFISISLVWGFAAIYHSFL